MRLRSACYLHFRLISTWPAWQPQHQLRSIKKAYSVDISQVIDDFLLRWRRLFFPFFQLSFEYRIDAFELRNFLFQLSYQWLSSVDWCDWRWFCSCVVIIDILRYPISRISRNCKIKLKDIRRFVDIDEKFDVTTESIGNIVLDFLLGSESLEFSLDVVLD